MDPTEQLLKELTDAAAPPGFEQEVRDILRDRLSGPGCEFGSDNLGSLIARLPGTVDRPRVLLDAHMDEIGFLVRYITDDGFLRFLPLGGWWDQAIIGHDVEVCTSKGRVPGLISCKPWGLLQPDEMGKAVPRERLFIDVGARSRCEVEALAVHVGDPVVPRARFTVLSGGAGYMAKAWDDRVGCAVLVEVLHVLAGRPPFCAVYGVGSVLEEDGGRGGASTAAYGVDPDVAFALEVASAGDMPGVSHEEMPVRLGGGPGVCIYDRSMIAHRRLRDLAMETAHGEGIPLQLYDSPRGGTDAGSIKAHARGVPSLVVGVPTRHIHHHYGVTRRDDLDATVRLMVALVHRLNAESVAALKG